MKPELGIIGILGEGKVGSVHQFDVFLNQGLEIK